MGYVERTALTLPACLTLSYTTMSFLTHCLQEGVRRSWSFPPPPMGTPLGR